MDPNELPVSDIQSAIASAVEEVLETMCFTPVFESGAGHAPPPVETPDGSTTLTAKLDFEGAPSGSFHIQVPSHLGRCVAASFLGRDDYEVSDPQIAQVLCELSNMFCGATLSRIEQDATFHLYHPEFSRNSAPQSAAEGAFQRWFDLGDGLLTASLHFDTTGSI
ncbi:MAG: chemotaxis protein CheX [Acidobacteria bacterium]|nr:chemotaxis protein CheX [Acidobacteriota bacterium]